MPCCQVFTNVPSVSNEFVSNLSKAIAASLGKPEDYVCITVNPGLPVSVGGSQTAPAAICHLYSIGKLSTKENKTHTTNICNVLKKDLSITPERVMIFFHDVAGANVGFGGSTFG